MGEKAARGFYAVVELHDVQAEILRGAVGQHSWPYLRPQADDSMRRPQGREGQAYLEGFYMSGCSPLQGL